MSLRQPVRSRKRTPRGIGECSGRPCRGRVAGSVAVLRSLAFAPLGVLSLVSCLAALQGGAAADAPTATSPQNPTFWRDPTFLQDHCIDCHNDSNTEGGLSVERLMSEPSLSGKALDQWTRIHDRVAAAEMPPADVAPPTNDRRDDFIASLSRRLRAAWQERYRRRGRVIGRRLNPVEYEYTMRDLLAAPWLELKSMLPPDQTVDDFDNVASGQEISYVQLGRYLEAAEVAIDGAMWLRPAPQPTVVRTWLSEEGRYLGKDWRERYGSLENRPEWTWFWQQPNSAQAPRRIRNTSQRAAGWYRMRIRCRAGLWDHGELKPAEVGQVAWVNTAAKRVLAKFDVPESPGGGVVEFTAWHHQDELLEFFYATADDRRVSRKAKSKAPAAQRAAHDAFMRTYRGHGIAIDWIEIEGPFADASCRDRAAPQTWPPESFRRLFGNLSTAPWNASSATPGDRPRIERTNPPEPLNLPDLTANKRGLRDAFQLPPEMTTVVSNAPIRDAERLLRRFLRKAYRRKPAESEVARCLDFVRDATDEGACFQDAMRLGYKAALCSPDFLFFGESPGRLDGAAIAARLSYLLWRSVPDETLSKVADAGTLREDSAILGQWTRMLADSRAERFFRDFTGQWLDLRKVHETAPDRYLFPEYFSDSYVVASAVAETEATFARMVRENLPVRTIVDTDFVMINERLARLYGIDGVRGDDIRPVRIPDNSPYGGLITQSSVMKVTANGLTTSPVIRGAWLMDRILGVPPLPPPPGVGSIEPDTRGATTVRELLDLHRKSDSCARCHARIDPPGFALESFDVMGKWRTHYRSFEQGERVERAVALRPVRYKRGLPVDASGVTPDGTSFEGINDFRRILLAREEQIARNLVTRFMTYATGGTVSFLDREEVNSILAEHRKAGYPVRSMFEAVILSETFRHK